MTRSEFDSTITRLQEVAEAIKKAKRPAYTFGKDDVLTNFKVVAERLGLSPLQVWAVYFLKHVDSLTTYAKDVRIPQAENVQGRFADAYNYLELGYALYVEDLTKVKGVDPK